MKSVEGLIDRPSTAAAGVMKALVYQGPGRRF
jgi:hypothetical protein